MATQPLVPVSTARQVPSRFNLRRQIAGTTGLAASCAALAAAAAALGGCAGDEPDLDLAACDAPEVYRIERAVLPRDNSEALALGLDLDREDAASSDNQLGLVLSTLDAQFQPLDVAAVMNDRLAGEVDWKLATRACGDRFAVSLGRGDRLDEWLDDVQLVGPAASGTDSRTIAARGAGGELPLSLMFDPAGAVADPGWLPGVLGAIEFGRSADGARLTGKLGVALDDVAAFEAIVPPLARFFDAHLEDGSLLITHFDQDRDGRITEAELRASPLFHSLLAPDLRIDGAPALSLGVGLSAVRAP